MIDKAPFPNVGNNPFYSNEFSIGAMLPQVPLNSSKDVICRDARDHASDPSDHYNFELLDEIEDMDPIEESTDTTKYPVYIVLMHTGTLLSSAIKSMTHSQFSHCSISFDDTLTNMYSFGRKADVNPFIGGFKSENINSKFFQSRDIPYALYMVLCTKTQIAQMKKRLDYFIANSSKFKYDFTGLLKNYFGIVDNPEYKWFCSRFVADIINAGKPVSNPVFKNPNLVKPEDFKDMPNAIYVTGGNLREYDPSKVRAITRKIINSSNSVVSENVLFDDKDLEFNLSSWAPGSKNILYVIGLSGSGKSTLAAELCEQKHATHVELDKISNQCKTKEDFDSQLSKMIKDMHNQKNTLFVVEGIQLPFSAFRRKDIDAEVYSSPLIIKGTSVLKSMARRIKRTNQIEDPIDRKDNLHMWTNISSLRSIINKYIEDEKALHDIKDRFASTNEGTNPIYKDSERDTTIQSIRSFNRLMNTNFTYGLSRNGKPIDPNYEETPEEFGQLYRLANPTQFEKQRGGVCWDYVTYEYNWFKKNYPQIPVTAWYIVFDDGKTYPTHTYITFKYNHAYYYFESAFKSIQGLYSANNESDILSAVLKAMDAYNHGILNHDYYVYKYNPIDPRLFGSTCEDFMKFIEDNGTEVSMRFNPRPILISEKAKDGKIKRVNDKGKEVPKVCPKCGAEVKVFIKGEPVWLCSNKDCRQYFGTVPFVSEAVSNTTQSGLQVHKKDTTNPNDDLSQKAVELTFFDNNKKIGECCISSIDTDRPFLYNLEVVPSERGKGYGTEIMDYCIKNYNAKEVTVDTDNKVAIHLYKKLGFDTIKKFHDKNGDKDRFYMVKPSNGDEDSVSEATEFKRSELPDSVFGIPSERKYPMPDRKHTISAMKLFNHCEKKYEAQLAKHIIKNIKKYDIDPSFIGEKNRLRKYLIRAKLISEGAIDMRDTNNIIGDMMYEFFGDTEPKSDADILFEKFFGEASMNDDVKSVPDDIEPMVKKLENKNYRVKYASPGHENTTFDNDKNGDGIVNGKLVSTGRIIFERDYHFEGTPKGWEWKVLSNGFKALYVKPFTYNKDDGSADAAFSKWKSDYLRNLEDWIDDLPMMDSKNPRNEPDKEDQKLDN